MAEEKRFRLAPKKHFSYIVNGRVVKRVDRVDGEVLIEALRDGIREILKPGSGGKGKPTITASSLKAAKRIITFFVLGIMLALSLLFLYLWLFVFSQGPPPPPQVYNPILQTSLIRGGIVSYASSGSLAPYLVINYSGSDMRFINTSAYLFEKEPPKQVLLVKPEGAFKPSSYEDFAVALSTYLKNHDIFYRGEVLASELEGIFTPSVIVITSPFIPREFVDANSPIFLKKLAKKGNVIFYIGYNFSTVIYNDAPYSFNLSEIEEELGISFSERPIPIKSRFRMNEPLYSVKKTSSDVISIDNMFYATDMGTDGALVLVPQKLDNGWRNATDAAEDIGYLIYSVSWQPVLSSGRFSVELEKPGKLEFTDSVFLLSTPKEVRAEEGYVVAYIMGTSWDNKTIERKITAPIKIEGSGSLVHNPNAINGTVLPITFTVRPNFTENTPIRLIFKTSNSSNAIVDLQYFRKGEPITVRNSPFTYDFDYVVDLADGDYIIRLVDESEHIYASSYLHIPVIRVKPITTDWAQSSQSKATQVFFKITSDDKPIDKPNIVVSYDNKGEVKVKEAREEMLPDINAKGFGAWYNREGFLEIFIVGLPEETTHNFTIMFPGKTIKLNKSFRVIRSPYEQPWFYGILIITAFVVIIGILFKRREKELYSIDVPDFPPMKRNAIPIPKVVVLSLFDQLNTEYKWKYMPLTIQEIQAGFRKIIYKGNPVNITEFNAKQILDTLVKEGLVFKELGLYGLKKWETESGKSASYLAIFRLLRTLFINHTIPFTDINQRKDCDTMITTPVGHVFIHIYEGEETLARVLRCVSSGTNIIIFRDKETLEKFKKWLDGSVKTISLMIKLEHSRGKITFMTVDKVVNLLI
ncbi:MAG: hypothetical protein QXP42_05425 [Candidatus Micrarchaeia archaeon]